LSDDLSMVGTLGP